MAMDYDPRDHMPTARQVLAAWVLCLGMIGLAVGLTAMRHDLTSTAAAADPIAVAPLADPSAMDGLRIPRFALCPPDPTRRSVAVAQRRQGSMSLPIDHCS
jgi:hypothetical protein